MENIYTDIAARGGGDIYIGVVGPVRTGKSTFIKRFMDKSILPNIDEGYKRERAVDELPQSAGGRTIMTTEPKFVPNEAVEVKVGDNASFKVRLIDCVGYVVNSALGHTEDGAARMVSTPWFEEDIPFDKAAEIGTQKVIKEHSTIGVVVTTDGSIADIERYEYVEAEERVVRELKEIGKPFVILLNSRHPESENVLRLKEELEEKYSAPVVAISCAEMEEDSIENVLRAVLFEFPITQIGIDFPQWIDALSNDHYLKESLFESVRKSVADAALVKSAPLIVSLLEENEYIDNVYCEKINLGDGSIYIKADVNKDLFYKILGEMTGFEIKGEDKLIELMHDLSKVKKEYERIKYALEAANNTGYGIVPPEVSEMSLEEPKIIKQGGRYGVKLKASAPSLHIIKANIQTEVSPIVGSEKQSEELIKYLLSEFESDPGKIWESNIFGKSLYSLVNEGLQTKLYKMPEEARFKLQETLQKIINEGSGGLICIIL
ncbi:MAG: stage IV sporulation protein A [Clostridia bacterium]|nr:stage IV sporulation protein A [Clostridia bacterium]